MDKTIEFEIKTTKKYAAIITLILLLIFLTILFFGILLGTFKDIKNALGLIILTLYLTFIYRTFFWYLIGKEQVKITEDNLVILKKGTFFVKPKTYELLKIKNLRLKNIKFNFLNFFVSRSSTITLKSYGVIFFEYENETINFCEGNDMQTKKLINILETKINEKYASK